jgi:hypothetical protein
MRGRQQQMRKNERSEVCSKHDGNNCTFLFANTHLSFRQKKRGQIGEQQPFNIGVDALYGPLILNVHFKDLQFLICRRPRYTLILNVAGIGAL